MVKVITKSGSVISSLTSIRAFRVTTTTPDASAFHKVNEDGEGSTLQRHVELSINCSFYGSECEKNAALLRDGFEISQNRDALRAANIGFKEIGEAVYVPELHGQVWFPRCDITFVLRRQVDKNFSVLSFESAGGTIEAQKSNDETENVQWNVSEQ